MGYLVRLRLHWVRAALLAAEPGSTLISTEALKWGFWHFGEFSRAYKQCFGEPPSRTLRREPDSTTAIPAPGTSCPRPISWMQCNSSHCRVEFGG